MLLAIDTSTAVASVALFDGEVKAEHTWRSGHNHTSQLLPRVEELLAEVGIRASELAGVGVALGPGSFNGLRVGLATAKLLGFSLGIPVVGVNTLEATAYQHREIGGLIRPLYDAGRGQLATALYSGAGGGLQEVEPPHIADPGEVAVLATEPIFFCGEIKASWAEELARRGGALARLVSAAGAARRAGYLAELAWVRLRAGEAADLVALQPLYLRRPSALEQPSAVSSQQGRRGTTDEHSSVVPRRPS